MASNVPIVRQITWIYLIPQLVVLGCFVLMFHLVKADGGESFICGALSYVFLSFGLRNLIAQKHREGMRLVKQQKFEQAIPLFEKSAAYFARNPWVDKYRFLTLLSSSKMTYKEMDLCNIAFCYSQTNQGQKAKEYYEQVQNEFPENGIAAASLRMLNSLGMEK